MRPRCCSDDNKWNFSHTHDLLSHFHWVLIKFTFIDIAASAKFVVVLYDILRWSNAFTLNACSSFNSKTHTSSMSIENSRKFCRAFLAQCISRTVRSISYYRLINWIMKTSSWDWAISQTHIFNRPTTHLILAVFELQSVENIIVIRSRIRNAADCFFSSYFTHTIHFAWMDEQSDYADFLYLTCALERLIFQYKGALIRLESMEYWYHIDVVYDYPIVATVKCMFCNPSIYILQSIPYILVYLLFSILNVLMLSYSLSSSHLIWIDLMSSISLSWVLIESEKHAHMTSQSLHIVVAFRRKYFVYISSSFRFFKSLVCFCYCR